jgi:hydroxymethylpyrimidine/phosphomethylpyrimidine kinase
VKTGMLFSAGNVRVVAEFFRNPQSAVRHLKLVVDPVMISTSSARLVQPAAAKMMRDQLLPLAALVTPNLGEAEMLAELKISTPEDLRAAARKIHARFGCAALVKGGHLKNCREAIDVFFDGETELLLSAPFIHGVFTHGTGCVYSAAVCAAVARGRPLPQAVQIGKNYVTSVIGASYQIGKHFALGQISPRH